MEVYNILLFLLINKLASYYQILRCKIYLCIPSIMWVLNKKIKYFFKILCVLVIWFYSESKWISLVTNLYTMYMRTCYNKMFWKAGPFNRGYVTLTHCMESQYKNDSTPCKISIISCCKQSRWSKMVWAHWGQESRKGRKHLPENALFTGASRVYSRSGRREDARPNWATRSVKVVCWFPASSRTCLAVK